MLVAPVPPDSAPVELAVWSPSGNESAVEAALAAAVAAATTAQQWDVVAQIAGELTARRLARAGAGVVDLAEARRKLRAT